MTKTCTCDKWKERSEDYFPKYTYIHGVKIEVFYYDIKYCPWCGKELTRNRNDEKNT